MSAAARHTQLEGLPAYGLLAHVLVQKLVAREFDVRRAVEEFAMGMLGRDHIVVAGPPSDEDWRRYRDRKNEACPLPIVTLTLRLTPIMLSQHPGVRVECSERDLEELGRWQHLIDERVAATRRQARVMRIAEKRAMRLGELPRAS